MTNKPFRDDPASWWIDHVIYFWFNFAARHDSVALKVFAMTFGTVWVLAAMCVGMPILMFDIGRDTWRSMSRSK